jgi:acyl carrier protein
MDAERALEILGRLLATDDAQRVVAAVDWSLLKPAYEVRRRVPFLDAVAAGSPRRRSERSLRLLSQLRRSTPVERRELLAEHVRGVAANVLRLPSPQDLDPAQGFFQAGMDSLMSVQLSRRLEELFGCRLPPAAVFAHPSVDALVAHLIDLLSLDGAEPEPENGHDDLREDELVALLRQKLEKIA